MTHFEFYAIPPSFMVDAAAIKRIFYQKSRQYHPDFHTLSDDAQQQTMLDMATLNNEAFQTLSDPDARMGYVLQLHGLVGEERSQATLPQDFLMEMMDINEAAMDLQFDFDQTRYDQTLQDIQKMEDDLAENVMPSLLRYDAAPPGAADDLKLVQEFFLKKRYLLRIKKNISTFAPA